MIQQLNYDEILEFQIKNYFIGDKSEIDKIKQSLELFGTNLNFEDNIWICDKLKKSEVHKGDNIIYFNPVHEEYRELMKYYAIYKLTEGLSAGSVNNKVRGSSKFLDFINKEGLSIYKLNKTIENSFYEYLKNTLIWSEDYKFGIWCDSYDLIKFIGMWEKVYIPSNIFRTCPFERSDNHEYKYIPDHVIIQLDDLFKREYIPDYIKLFYWIARSIPSRVTEVLGMKLDCIKPYGKDQYVVIIPTWKQNGGHKQAQIRRVYLKYDGHGKFLIDLIKKQQEYVHSLQNKIPEKMKGYLFVHQRFIFRWREFERSGNTTYYVYKDKFILPDRSKVARDLSKICKRYEVKDEFGEIYCVTSHQLRHNGITDRIYAGFSPIQVMLMTEHQSDAMIVKSYTHRNNDILLEKQRAVNKEEYSTENGPVMFRGRILNMDEKLEARLLANKRAYRLKGIGICSDITGCQSGIFECLDCDYFVPDSDKLDYFKEQVLYWEDRVELFKNNKSLKENAEYNLELHKKIVVKIENALLMEA